MAIKRKFDAERNDILNAIREFLTSKGYECLTTKSNQISIPVVDAERNEGYVVLTAQVPTGSRDGDPYDGYAEAEDYARHIAEQAAKKEEAARKKAIKIQQDTERRARAAALKAERKAAADSPSTSKD